MHSMQSSFIFPQGLGCGQQIRPLTPLLAASWPLVRDSSLEVVRRGRGRLWPPWKPANIDAVRTKGVTSGGLNPCNTDFSRFASSLSKFFPGESVFVSISWTWKARNLSYCYPRTVCPTGRTGSLHCLPRFGGARWSPGGNRTFVGRGLGHATLRF
jgi:hypothetical protein